MKYTERIIFILTVFISEEQRHRALQILLLLTARSSQTIENTLIIYYASYRAVTSNFVHEVTHAYEAFLDLINSRPLYMNNGNSEIEAYRAQYCYDPSSLPVATNNISQITVDWVKLITYVDEDGKVRKVYNIE